MAAAVAAWQDRRDLILRELEGVVPAITPHGGWSMLLDVGARGLTGEEASRRLLERGGIAATSMANWGGPATARYLRFVFANEPVGASGRHRCAGKQIVWSDRLTGKQSDNIIDPR